MHIIPPRPSSNFTQVPNQVIFHPDLTDRDKLVWCMLRSLCYATEGAERSSVPKIAEELQIPARNLQRSIKRLSDNGLICRDGEDLILQIDRTEGESVEVVQERKLNQSDQLRADLQEVWNKNKLENFPTMRKPLTPSRLHVLKLHGEHCGITDLTVLLRTVLASCKANDWYSKVSQDFDNIFGSSKNGGEPNEAKFSKVQKMTKVANSAKGRALTFDSQDDQCWIDWFSSKGHAMTSVKRLEMERWAGYEYEADHRGDGVIYLIVEDNCLVHWTYKESQKGVSYLPTAR